MQPTERSRRPEHRLLLRAAEWNLKDEGTRVDVPDGVDWTYFARQARAHSMAAPAYRWLAARSDVEVPAAVASTLEGDARAATFGALEKVDTLHRVFEILEAEGIRALPYKGPTLRARVHDDVAFREAADVDVLLPEAALLEARSALLAEGFRAKHDVPDLGLRVNVRGGRHTTVLSEGVRVELHCRTTAGHFPFPVDFEELWGRRRSVEVAGKRLPAVPPEELIVLLAVHGNTHCWRGLCWLCDFAGALRTFEFERNRLLSTAADLSAQRMLFVGFELANRLLDVAPPTVETARWRDDAVTSIADWIEERFLWENSIEPLTKLRYKFTIRERFRERTRMAARLALVPNRYDVEWLPKPARYYPLAVLARPFRVVGKVGRLLIERARRRASG